MKKQQKENLPESNPLSDEPAPCVKSGKPIAEDSCDPSLESTVESFAWDTVKRVRRLAKLSKRFPEQARNVARQLLAWPVMSTMPYFDLEDGNPIWHPSLDLELGREYPLDTSSRARFHSSSEMGLYLTQWIKRLHYFRLSVFFRPQQVPRQAKVDENTVKCCWRNENEPEPGPNLVAVLRIVLKVPPLTKATSHEWSKRVLVPIIMLSDAGSDETSCGVPALQRIWRQKGVKSVATFKSRLLTSVRQIARDRTRPA